MLRMTSFTRGLAATGVAAVMLLSSTGIAHQAGKPVSRRPHRLVLLFNQTVLIAEGLSPVAALRRAGRIVRYTITTPHYIPRGFRLATVRAYPFIPGTQEPQDTQTFSYFTTVSAGEAPRKVSGHGRGKQPAPRVAVGRDFEVDHQLGQPYVYEGAFFTNGRATVARHGVTVAEQRYHSRKGAIDLLYVYWYDRTKRLATEVTADLQSSHLTKQQLLQVVGSIS